ncbi:MAG: hypothetical protein AAF555_06345 [Verrucomicrobiota bacterium]
MRRLLEYTQQLVSPKLHLHSYLMMKKTLLACVATGLVLSAIPTQAELPVSRRAGILPVSQSTGAVSLVSVPYTIEPDRFDVASVSGSTVTTASSVGTYTNPIARIVGGTDDGAIFSVSSASGTSVVLGDAPASDTLAVEIYEQWTLDTLFANGGSFSGAAAFGGGDILGLVNSSGTDFDLFYYNTTNSEWRTVAEVAAGGTIVPHNQGILVLPASADPVVVSGVARSGDQTPTYPLGQVSVVNYPFGTAFSFADLDVSQINGAAAFGGGDIFLVPNAGGTDFDQFYYNTTSGEFRTSAEAPVVASAITFAAGETFAIIPASNLSYNFEEGFAE